MARLRLGENIASDRDGAQVPFRQATIASFVESAIVGSLTSSESRLFARAWQGVAASRNGSGERLVDLLMPILTPSSKEAAMGISSPDIGWILERLAEAVSRLSDGPDSEHLINFEKYRTVWSLIDSSTHVFPAQVEPALVENAGARLKFMQQALGKVVWDRRLFKEDANHELTSAPFLPLPSKSRSGFKPLAATALAQQDKMRRDRQALEVLLQPDPTSRLSHQLEVVDPAYGAAGNPSAVAPDKSATRGRRMTALFRGAVRPMGLMAEKHEVAARSIAELLALTPTQKASFVAGCAGAHVAVWNNSQRSYVFHLTSEEGGKYLLQAPQQGEMAEWFAHIERAAKEHPATKASDGRKGNKGRYIRKCRRALDYDAELGLTR